VATCSVSYQHPRDSSDGVVPNSPAWLGKMNFSTPLATSGLSLGYELQYSSKRAALDGSDVDGNWQSNLNLNTDKIVPGLDVSLSLYNLFDVRYAYPSSRNNWQSVLDQDGRSVRVKVSYKF